MQFHAKLVPDQTPNTSGDIVKTEYITVYASENIVPISATIPILIAESIACRNIDILSASYKTRAMHKANIS